jgi:hypothetical protein
MRFFMSEPTINNSAGRLYRLFVSTFGKTGNGIAIWRDAFGISHIDDEAELELEVALRLREVRLLTFDVERELREVTDADVEVYVATLPDFRRALNMHHLRTSNYEVILQGISPHALSLVKLAAELLATRHLEPVISEEDLNKILADVRELFTLTKEAVIDETLRQFTLDSLAGIERAIQEFRIRGPKHLEDALVRIAGEFTYRYTDIRERAKQDEVSENIFGRLKRIVGKVDALIRFTDSGVRLIHAGSRILALLGPGGGIPPVS